MSAKPRLSAMAAAMVCLCLPAGAAVLPPVTLAWNQNPEPDVAGYEVKYGTVPGIYDTTLNAGLNTSLSVSGLSDGLTYHFVLIAINADGLRSEPAELSYGTPPPNQAPESTIAVPSSDVGITAGQSISFSGGGSDPDGNAPLAYHWDFGSGAGIADSTLESPGSLRFDQAGTYTVTLTVTDSLGLPDPTPAIRTITVLPPVVVDREPESTISSPASNVSLTAGGVVLFSGSGSDPDGNTPLTYQWHFGSGSGIADSTSARPRWRRFDIPGTYEVTFTVTNSLGLADSSPASRTITVAPLEVANQAPESTISTPATDLEITVGGSLSFSGGGNDPDGNEPLSYRWSFGSGAGFADSTSQNPGIRRFNTAGTYEVTLTVSDSLGLADPTPAVRIVTVSPPNQGPESTILEPPSDISVAEGGVVYFSGVGSDPDGDAPLTYGWSFGDGSGIADSTEPSPGTRIFKNPGTYLVTFTASDSLGAADLSPATRTITVIAANQAPESTIASPASDLTINAGQSVDFAGNGDDPNGDTPLAYSWSLVSESGVASSTDQNPGLVGFDTPGTYQVSLTVTDAKGLADPTPAMRTVLVLAPPPVVNQAPESTITAPASDLTIAVGESVRFAGAGEDPDGDMPLTYLWNLGIYTRWLDSGSPEPGSLRFWRAGTYEVVLTVTDAKGLADSTPATRLITVVTPASNQAPDAAISAPSGDVSINAGESVDFAASAEDPDGDTPLTYLWSFGDGSGVADSTSGSPGPLRFDNPGIYQVVLTVTDSKGLADPSPARCTVTVNAVANRAPFSSISAPAGDVTVTAGESVAFSGLGHDPDGHTPLAYLWSFGDGSGIADSTAGNPGAKRFDTPGTFEVNFTASDSLGLADSTPAVRRVTVLAAETSIPGFESWITSPESDLTISVGETVWFAGFGINNYRWGALNYRWNFGAGSGIPDSTEKRPGALRFDNPGTYVVSFAAINPKGVADPSPARVTVTVTGGASQAAMAKVSEPQPVMAREAVDGKSYLTFTVTKPLVDDQLARTVELSSDLKTWHSGPEHVTTITDDSRTLKVRATKPVSEVSSCFFRLKTAPKSEVPAPKAGL